MESRFSVLLPDNTRRSFNTPIKPPLWEYGFYLNASISFSQRGQLALSVSTEEAHSDGDADNAEAEIFFIVPFYTVAEQ